MSTGNSRKKSDALKLLESATGGPVTLARLIEAIRLGEEMTQPEFAKRLGISKSHLNDIEKGRKVVSPERAARFARALAYSEKRFVKLALQAQLDQFGLKFRVALDAA
ncbi:MAG: helix-turn-helix domain-containing protein [Bdellovibrionota bacterium]